MATLQVRDVVKRYRTVTAADHVSFSAEAGRILGILGPNGAGKTSTIRMITYITTPDEGEVLFEGTPVGPWSQRRMGYLPEERGLYKKLKVGEQLLLLAELKGLARNEARARIQHWLDRFGATDWFDKKTEELSKGMQQKVQFIATILPEPDLIILDEPFSGLDPINSELLKDIILELKASGCTLLFASHRMEQVEQLCDDICLMAQGQVVVEGPLREVKQRFGKDTVLLEFAGSPAFLDPLVTTERVRVINKTQQRAEVRLLNNTRPREVLEAALAGVEDVYRFEVMTPPLAEIFKSLVGKRPEEMVRTEAPQPAEATA